jgi:purine-nucleoside phosphorylase
MTLAAPALPAAPNEASGAHIFEAAEASARVIRGRFSARPDAAIILGTGLGRLAMEIENPVAIPYEDIPGFPASTVESHAGRLLCGTLGARTVIAMQGRFHRYEGYSLQQVTFPVRVLRALGADTLFVSNACGGLNPLWNAGDLMLITDHVNLLGDSPLIGALARRVAADEGIGLREGVYVAVVGPNLETRAEYRFLRAIGADVVGMSTVPETIVAVHSGMRVLGLSIITDMCDPDALEPATVEKIIAVANRAEPALTTLVRRVLERM